MLRYFLDASIPNLVTLNVVETQTQLLTKDGWYRHKQIYNSISWPNMKETHSTLIGEDSSTSWIDYGNAQFTISTTNLCRLFPKSHRNFKSPPFSQDNPWTLTPVFKSITQSSELNLQKQKGKQNFNKTIVAQKTLIWKGWTQQRLLQNI